MSATTRICAGCKTPGEAAAMHTHVNKTTDRKYYYCKECTALWFFTCTCCSSVTPKKSMGHLNRTTETGVVVSIEVCKTCLISEGWVCACCGIRMWNKDPKSKSGTCARCVKLAQPCPRCGVAYAPHFRFCTNAFVDSTDPAFSVCKKCYNKPAESSTFKKNPFKRFIGVEMEFLLPNGHSEVPLSAYGNVKGDSSVLAVGYKGREFNLWPLNGDRLLAALDDVTKTLVDAHCITNQTCGLHVHLDMRTMTEKQRINLERWWYVFEFVIHGMVEKSRIGNRYTMKASEHPSTERYRALNTTNAFAKFGTFEVRLHHGTLNNVQVKNWVMFLLSFFDTFTVLELTDELKAEVLSLTMRNRVAFLMGQTKMSMTMRKAMLRALWTHKHGEAIKAITKSGSSKEKKAEAIAAAEVPTAPIIDPYQHARVTPAPLQRAPFAGTTARVSRALRDLVAVNNVYTSWPLGSAPSTPQVHNPGQAQENNNV